jgi:hypothetical protein
VDKGPNEDISQSADRGDWQMDKISAVRTQRTWFAAKRGNKAAYGKLLGDDLRWINEARGAPQ